MAKGIARYGILFSLVLYSSHSQALSVGDLLISEIMVNPAALSDVRGEWFELYNPSDQQINLRGLGISDDGDDAHSFESDLLILPGEYLTLARTANPGFTPAYVYDNFTLSNSGDEIVFSDGFTELLRFAYGADFDRAGQSRELRKLPLLEANYQLTPASLVYGLGDVGTPGAPGSSSWPGSGISTPATGWLFISGALALLLPRLVSRRNCHFAVTQS